MKGCIVVLLLITSLSSFCQTYHLQKVEASSASSFRGLSVIDDKVAWVSGNKGQVGLTTDGGQTWNFNTVAGHEGSDFRSIYAFDDQHAIIANAGAPAHILVTMNGGASWKLVYKNEHKDAFFDGIDFWNDNEGIIYGDPIDGKMLLLRSINQGDSWLEIPTSPILEKGEASFAASGTGIRCTNKNEVIICTGGVVSRLWISKNKGESWTALQTPIVQGESATGIFSTTLNKNMLIIVGGDFQNESMTTNHHFYSMDGGAQWVAPATTVRGYRECVEFISEQVIMATGPSGVDISYDNGFHWEALSDEKGLHVVRKARRGSLVLAAGGKGLMFLIK